MDTVKVKMGAPKRISRSPAVLPFNKDEISAPVTEREETPEAMVELAEPAESNEHFTDAAASSEDIWLTELKELLQRLEPIDGEEIYQTYLAQQESYQSELDGLLSEKQQKTTEDSVTEMEQQISQLDLKHEEKLKEVFGIHYDTIQEHHQEFMENSPSQDE